MTFTRRPQSTWKLRTRALALGQATLVMGIVNVTPDSFSQGGAAHGGHASTAGIEAAVALGLRLLDEGAAILDIGGESTRPGSHAASDLAIPGDEEQDRVLPVIEALHCERPAAVLSIDTYRAGTARLAIGAGCEIVNDVSGLLWDQAMAATVSALGCGLVLTHTRGRPDEWHTLPQLLPDAILPLVRRELGERLDATLAACIQPERVVLDPGYGFGKAFDANYSLLAGQAELLALGRPLLAGVSRKSFLGRTLAPLHEGRDAAPIERGPATIAATVAAALAGASIVRVHEVRSAVEAVAIADAILAAGEMSAK